MRARIIGAALAALLVPAAPALAAGDGKPVRFWSLSRIDASAGKTTVASGAQEGGRLHKVAKLGPAPFVFPETDGATKAIDRVISSADGSHYNVVTQAPSPTSDPTSARGGVSHLDEYQAYRKRSGDASLRITISEAIADAIDENRTASGCPPKTVAACPLLRGIVRFHARAYAASAGGDFFSVGGAAYLEGHRGDWTYQAATDADSRAPVWSLDDFEMRQSFDKTPRAQHRAGPRFIAGPTASLRLHRKLRLRVPLGSVHDGELFAVHVMLEAEASDARGGESTALAFIDDPQSRESLLASHGLKPLGKPRFREPKPTAPAAARCPAGPRRGAGRLQLSRDAFAVDEAGGTPAVLVTRTGGSRGAASVTVGTSDGSALGGQDFTATRTRVRFGDGDSAPRLVEIPIREDTAAEPAEQFTVSLGHARCAPLGARRHAPVTILDDDAAPPPPPRAFSVGGTVDGLEGSGLVLVNGTTLLPVTGNGPFTFPGTFPDGSPYDVRIQAQPANPTQVCSVVDGTGTVSADVSTVAVHCARLALPAGLDTTFGSEGRVSTPGSGKANAVVLQPDGHIIAVGPREIGVNFQFEFGAVRYDASGNLDPGFGTGGIATTRLGGNDDEATDAALLSDGGFVAVGHSDVHGIVNTDFGVARYTADGQPAPGFGASGFVTTDITGHADLAQAVAVQPDGKIVAAGEAQSTLIDFDFAVVRYNPDGTLDHSFGGDGIVTTDLGTEGDGARGVAIQPDGKIVVAGPTDTGVGLARYEPDGTLDRTFGGDGTVVADIGTNLVNGVALTPGGTIFVAGSRGGANTGLDIIVASFGPNGELNRGFGTLGVAQADLSGSGGFDIGNDLALDSIGDIVVVGSATSPTIKDMALVRFRPDGAFDTSLKVDFHGFGDEGNALAFDAHGAIVAAGDDGAFEVMRAFL